VARPSGHLAAVPHGAGSLAIERGRGALSLAFED
jgi:hypothetical protein